MHQLTIQGYKIPYKELRNARYKRITLTALGDCLRISFPKNISSKHLHKILLARQELVLKVWLESQQSLKRDGEYCDGQKLLYRGSNIELKLFTGTWKSPQVILEDQELRVYLPENVSKETKALSIERALKAWYQCQARQILQEKLMVYSRKMHVRFQMFRLKEQRTRWGSCSSKGNINLNWRIILAPDEAVNYIVVHELAHITHFNHSEEFWQRVAEFIPEYKYWRRWFQEHGRELWETPFR